MTDKPKNSSSAETIGRAEKSVQGFAKLMEIAQNVAAAGGSAYGLWLLFRGKRDRKKASHDDQRSDPNRDDVGGKNKPSDEKWYGFTLRHTQNGARNVWVDTIMPELHADFGNGTFGRIGHNDLTNDVRVILEAMAQEETPITKSEKRDTQGKVKEVTYEPDPNYKPLSSWCIEYFVDVYMTEKDAQINKKKVSEKKAHEIAISKTKMVMRDAGFPIGRNAGFYHSMDQFLAKLPKSPKNFASAVKRASKGLRQQLTPLRETIHKGSEAYKTHRASLPDWRRWLRS